MDHEELQKLVTAGEDFLFTKATLAIVVWDHVITFSDEVKYVWKGEKTWTFWLFIVSRYSILLFKAWVAVSAALFHNQSGNRALTDTLTAAFWPGYTQACEFPVDICDCEGPTLGLCYRCERTVKLQGYYFIFIITLGHVFLTMRVYALTEARKFVLVIFGVLVTSSFLTGMYFFSVPSATAVQMPKIPLDPYRACIFTAPDKSTWVYRSQVAVADFQKPHTPTDLVTFVCIVVFVFKLKADHGQSRMSRLMQTILQDGVLYFFVMAAFHAAMVFFTALRRPSVLPPVVIVILIPVMISRLAVSLRKAVDTSLIQVWDRDHFTGAAAESGVHEMINFARPRDP